MSHADDTRSEVGENFGGMFEQPAAAQPTSQQHSGPAAPANVASEGVTRQAAPVAVAKYGRKPAPYDKRKYKYDRIKATKDESICWDASRSDRMDVDEAGTLLDSIHAMLEIDKSPEAIIKAFDDALWFEHAINGASQLQPGRGVIRVLRKSADGEPGEDEIPPVPIASIVDKLGVDMRRFFRAYADDIAVVVRDVLKGYQDYDPVSRTKCGLIRAIAIERGLQKFPHLIHDSSDAGVELTTEERLAVIASKRYSPKLVGSLTDEKLLASLTGSPTVHAQ